MKLFINYRREDTDDFVGRLYDRLIAEFGSENVFKDVDSIRPGQNWKAVLEQSVAGCDIVLTLIGKHWASCVDAKGRRRLANEEDWVRFELEAANRNRRLVMPVLVKGAAVPSAEELPESLHWLPEIHVTEIRGDPHFKDDVAHLVSDLRLMHERLAEQVRLAPHAPAAPVAGADAGGGAIVCPKCKRMGPRTDQFCEGCGAALWDVCPKCHVPVPAGQRFCKNCGADIPKLKQADAAYDTIRARFNDLALCKDSAERLQRAEGLLRELEPAARLAPDHAPLTSLRRQLVELTCETARQAAAAEIAGKRFGKALYFYQRLTAWGGATEDATANVNLIHQQREQKLNEANTLTAKGSYKEAAALLGSLLAAFPDDAPVKDAHDQCQKILERARQLMSGGLRELQAQRRLLELDRALAWLEAQRIRSDKLPAFADSTRKKIASANALVAKALAELHASNFKAAAKMARSVLDTVADHEGALEIVRSSGGMVERVAHLEELVQLRQWCAANALLRELEDKLVSDPRLSKLVARIKTQMAEIDFYIRLLVVLIAGVIGVGIFGVPWLTSVVPAPSGWDKSFFYYVWAGGSALVLAITWWSSENKTQILRRVLSSFPGGRAQPRSAAGVEVVPVESSATAISGTATLTTSSTGIAVDAAASLDAPVEVMPIDDSAPAHEGTAPILNAAEKIQRVESAARSLEWLFLGVLTSWVAFVLASWLMGKLMHNAPAAKASATQAAAGNGQPGAKTHNAPAEKASATGWFAGPLTFAILAIALIPVSLYVGGFRGWRKTLAITGVPLALLLILAAAVPAEICLGVAFILYWICVGTLAATFYKVPLWRGACTALGGPLAGVLIASPFLIGFIYLAVVLNPDFVTPKHDAGHAATPILLAAFIWCALVVLCSTASQTLVRYVVMDRLVPRGICALGLALALAAGIFLLVAVLVKLLNDNTLWLTSWAVFFALAQLVPPLLRWQWRWGFWIPGALGSLVLILLIALMEWLSPRSSVFVTVWVITATAVALLNAPTTDVIASKAEVWQRLRTRMRSRKLPVRIEVTRR